jgi:acyl-CoA synthetase (NDP forming)
MTDVRSQLARAFNPRAVAVVGDKRAIGYMWLESLRTFQGPVYSVQIDPAEIEGIKALGFPNYLRLQDIPGPVDYVMASVPRQVAPRIVVDCAEKGVAAVAFFTSGFAETGEEEGLRLQREMGDIARRNGLLIVGPNCVGLYNARLGLRNSPEQTVGEGGKVAFISQSGTHCINFTLLGPQEGVPCAKAASIGNAEVLDVPDYLDYFLHDPEVEVIAMYVEGVRDGRRFFSLLREATRRKPVVVWKGGMTEAGARAAFSHTASLATAPDVWRAAMRQAGAIEVDSLEEALDVCKALLLMPPTTGQRMGLVAMTGGQSVVITDAFQREGLDVPLLSPRSYEKLSSFFTVIGGSYRNPLDAGWTVAMGLSMPQVERLLSVLADDENIDLLVFEVGTNFLVRRLRENPQLAEVVAQSLASFREQCPKPLAAVVHPSHLPELGALVRQKMVERGIPVFPDFRRAAKAIARAIGYWRFLKGVDG